MQPCPIWGERYPVEDTYHDAERRFVVPDSPRAGGGYKITGDEKRPVKELTDAEKARLTTLLIDQRRLGTELPAVTLRLIEKAKRRQPLPVYERAHRLLQYMARTMETVGTRVHMGSGSDEEYAWSESTNDDEISYLLSYLRQYGLIQATDSGGGALYGTVTVEGYRQIEEQETNRDSSQAFVAMWFHDTMDRAFEQGIRPGIEDAGYTALRVDRIQHINKIDDEIVAQIRRSRFLVADFTEGADGNRGGVYYEAGFAYGLGLPVIYICRLDMVDKLSFDTRQYNHILWDTPEELREGLRDRIGRVIGDGPGTTA